MPNAKRTRLLLAALLTTAVVGAASTVWQVQAGFQAAPATGPAASAQWSGSMVLRNDGTAPATVVLNFYAADGALVKSYTVPGTVPPKGTITVDTEAIPELPAGFLGSAVVSSNQPISATWLGFDPGNPEVNRTLYNGFVEGARTVFMPSISSGYNDQTSTIAVQNTENSPASITMRLFERFSGTLAAQFSDTLPANASHYYDVSNLPAGISLAPPWTGSALVESTGARLAVAVHQPRLSSAGASVFEGVAGGGTSVYFPSVLYLNGPRGMTTNLSVQNTANAPANVDVTFYNPNGTPAGVGRVALGPYQKQNVTPAAAGLPGGWSGSAIARSGVGIAAVANTNGAELSTAYAGAIVAAPRGSLPLIRWAAPGDARGLRTTIEVLNADPGLTADITIKYYDQGGTLVNAPAFRNVPPAGKVTHSPGEFVGDGAFNGTAEVEASRGVVAVVSAVSVDGASMETYSSMPIP